MSCISIRDEVLQKNFESMLERQNTQRSHKGESQQMPHHHGCDQTQAVHSRKLFTWRTTGTSGGQSLASTAHMGHEFTERYEL